MIQHTGGAPSYRYITIRSAFSRHTCPAYEVVFFTGAAAYHEYINISVTLACSRRRYSKVRLVDIEREMGSPTIITMHRTTPKCRVLSVFYEMNGTSDRVYSTRMCCESSGYYIVLVLVALMTPCFLTIQYLVSCGTAAALLYISCYDVHRVFLSVLLACMRDSALHAAASCG